MLQKHLPRHSSHARPPNATPRAPSVVVCGGGIVGVSTAFYLSARKGVPCTLVERHEVAGAASGKSGGFLALDWNDSSPVRGCARVSMCRGVEALRVWTGLGGGTAAAAAEALGARRAAKPFCGVLGEA